MTCRLVTLTVLALSCLTACAGAASSDPPSSATISFTASPCGAPIFDLRSGDITGHFLLASDCTSSWISHDFAARLKLVSEPITISGQSYYGAVLPRLTLGAPCLQMPDSVFLDMDLSALTKRCGTRIDGVIGANMLSSIAVALDYQKNTITLWNHGNVSDADLAIAGFDHAFAAEIRGNDEDCRYFIPSVLRNGTQSCSVDLQLNTSCAYNTLPPGVVTDLSLSQSHPWNHPLLDATAAESMMLGTASVSSPAFMVSGDQASLGINTLSRYRTLIDAAAGKLYMVPRVSAVAPPSARGLRVPFEYGPSTRHKIIVRASIDGRPPQPFVLDTGMAQPLLLDRDAALTLGICETGKDTLRLNGVFPASEGTVSSLVILGRSPADNLAISLSRTLVADLKVMRHMSGLPIAGVIGAGILSDTAVKLDFSSKIATFYPAPLVAPTPPKAACIPFLPALQQDAYCVGIDFGKGKPSPLLVDTGSFQLTVPPDAARDWIPVNHQARFNWIGGILMIGEDFNIPHLDLGGVSAENVDVTTLPIDHTPIPIPGTLGLSALSQFNVTLDIPHNRLILEPTANSIASNEPTGWTGMLLADADDNTIKVSGAEPASPAFLAGINSGETLLSIDGQSTINQGYCVVRDLLWGKANLIAVVEVRETNGALRTVRIRRRKIPARQRTSLSGLYASQYEAKPMHVDLVMPGSSAALAGIQIGDTITAIDGHPMASIAAGHFFDPSQASVTLTVRKQDKGMPWDVRLVAPAADSGKRSPLRLR